MPKIGSRVDYTAGGFEGLGAWVSWDMYYIHVSLPFLAISVDISPRLPKDQQNADGQPHAQPQNHEEAGAGGDKSPPPARPGE